MGNTQINGAPFKKGLPVYILLNESESKSSCAHVKMAIFCSQGRDMLRQ